MPLKSIDFMLSEYSSFMRCHQGYIINIDYVSKIVKRDFIMKDNTPVPISENDVKEVVPVGVY